MPDTVTVRVKGTTRLELLEKARRAAAVYFEVPEVDIELGTVEAKPGTGRSRMYTAEVMAYVRQEAEARQAT